MVTKYNFLMFACQILGARSKSGNKNIITIFYRNVGQLFESNIQRNGLIKSKLSVIFISSGRKWCLCGLILVKTWQQEHKVEKREKKSRRFTPVVLHFSKLTYEICMLSYRPSESVLSPRYRDLPPP